MIKIWKKISFIVILTIGCFGSSHAQNQSASPSQATPTLVFTTFDINLPDRVIYQRVLDEAYGRLGITWTMEKLPGKRALKQADNGDYDGELFRGKAIEKSVKNLVRIPVPIGSIKVVVFTIHQQFEVKGWESLKPYTVGIMRGLRQAEIATKDHKRQMADTPNQLFKMLKSERIDIAVFAYLNGWSILKQMGFDKMSKVLQPPVQETPLYHYLHKKHMTLIPKLTSILGKMQEEGSLAKIIAETEEAILNQ